MAQIGARHLLARIYRWWRPHPRHRLSKARAHRSRQRNLPWRWVETMASTAIISDPFRAGSGNGASNDYQPNPIREVPGTCRSLRIDGSDRCQAPVGEVPGGVSNRCQAPVGSVTGGASDRCQAPVGRSTESARTRCRRPRRCHHPRRALPRHRPVTRRLRHPKPPLDPVAHHRCPLE